MLQSPRRLQPHIVQENPWPGVSWQLSQDEERGVQGDKTERWIEPQTIRSVDESVIYYRLLKGERIFLSCTFPVISCLLEWGMGKCWKVAVFFFFFKSDEFCCVKASPIHMEVKGSRWPLWELLRCCRWRMFHLIHALSLNPEIQTYYSCLKPCFSCLICNIYSKLEVISFWKQEQTLLLPTVTDFLLRPWKMPLF